MFYLEVAGNIVSWLDFHHLLEFFSISVNKIKEWKFVHILSSLIAELNNVDISLQKRRFT